MKKDAKPGKLTKLLSNWPKGTVAPQRWLGRQGIPRQLAERYRRSGWLRRLERGAYARLNDSVDWTGGLYAMQYQLDLLIHAGGKTALELQGYAHFVPAGRGGRVQLFGPLGTRLPAWFAKHNWDVLVQYVATNLFHRAPQLGLTEKQMGDYTIRLSAPERGMLELLTHVSDGDSLEEARLLMEGLTGLRPELVQELLESCRSVKAKRLFLFLADLCGHSWVDKLDVLKVDLGKGKRSIVKGGHLDSRYQITVPAKMGRAEVAPESA